MGDQIVPMEITFYNLVKINKNEIIKRIIKIVQKKKKINRELLNKKKQKLLVNT